MRHLLYRSSYLNSTIALRTADEQIIGLVAGKHQRYFPHYHENSKWDSLLIYNNGVSFACNAYDIATLRIELNEPSQSRLAFCGELKDSKGQLHELDIELRFRLEPGKRYALGKLLDRPWIPGLDWQPFFCTLQPAVSRFVIDGRVPPLRGGHGEIERGALTNLTWRTFAFRYDYCCLAQPDAGYVLLDFATRSLTRRNPVEACLDWLLRRTATMTLRPLESPDRASQVALAAQVLTEDRVDLGLSLLDRQLITVRDHENRELLGLREIFHPQQG